MVKRSFAESRQAVPEPGDLPVLYSFRRCPYAMRARLALAYAGIQVEMREILLKDKPQAMLDLSAKGTVPVLQLPDGRVIDESIDVMCWALAQHDPEDWLGPQPDACRSLIDENDGPFKTALDRYKYHVRFPEHPKEYYRRQGEEFFRRLEGLLGDHDGLGLLCEKPSLADMAIFPFVRQFANSDIKWFEQAPYPYLRAWLDRHVQSAFFQRVMKKYPLWKAGDQPLIVDWQ